MECVPAPTQPVGDVLTDDLFGSEPMDEDVRVQEQQYEKPSTSLVGILKKRDIHFMVNLQIIEIQRFSAYPRCLSAISYG